MTLRPNADPTRPVVQGARDAQPDTLLTLSSISNLVASGGLCFQNVSKPFERFGSIHAFISYNQMFL